jgi:hypothetical protein
LADNLYNDQENKPTTKGKEIDMKSTVLHIEDIKIRNVGRVIATGKMAIKVSFSCIRKASTMPESEMVSLSVIIEDGTNKTIEQLIDESIKKASAITGEFIETGTANIENTISDSQ